MVTEWLQDQAYEGFIRDLDVEHMGFTDEQINVVLDVDCWQETKTQAWSNIAHRDIATLSSLFCHARCSASYAAPSIINW